MFTHNLVSTILLESSSCIAYADAGYFQGIPLKWLSNLSKACIYEMSISSSPCICHTEQGPNFAHVWLTHADYCPSLYLLSHECREFSVVIYRDSYLVTVSSIWYNYSRCYAPLKTFLCDYPWSRLIRVDQNLFIDLYFLLSNVLLA